jgi:5-methylthioadenosine/S-adenosylhomocysteine deaminase
MFAKPDLGDFLEVKSRTWSRTDAEKKARLVAELVAFLGGGERVTQDYVEMVR